MFRNYLKIALRTLRKNRIYTAVNLISLTVGIAAVLLIFRMVSYELSFNKNFENYDRIVRVVAVDKDKDGTENHSVCTPIPAMDEMEETISQFERMSRIKEFWVMVSQPDPAGGPPLKKFNMEDRTTAFFVEPDFFEIFDLQWIAGDPATAVSTPNTIILTESWVKKLFNGPQEAMGQTLVMDNVVPVTVTGIVADLPVNCDFPVPFLSSWETLKANADHFFYNENWGSCSSNNQVYALLGNTGQMDAANEVLAKVGAEHYQDRRSGRVRNHVLQPLSELHFDERYQHSGTHRISKTRLRLLSGIGILIIIMACFNFINLATAQSLVRAKEVGVRKTLGGERGQLVGQFMSETGVIVVGAVGLGVILAAMGLPLLRHVSDVPQELPFLSDPLLWGFLGIIAVLVTFLAGLYPSLALASFRPVEALNNQAGHGRFAGANVRKSLVVLQFMIAQGLIIAAIIALLQLDYIRSRDLGFSKDLVYTFSVGVDSSSIARQRTLKQEMLQIPSVETMSFSSDQPLSGNTWATNFKYGSRPDDESYSLTLKFCDADYQKTYGLKMLAGQWYQPSDTMRQGVVNETLLRKLAINDPQEAVGQVIRMGRRPEIQITGVVEDFHTHTLHREHLPLMMTTRTDYYWEVGVKIQPFDISQSLADMQRVFDRVLPEQVFEGRFLDEGIARFYEDENRLSATCKSFGLLAILISCLGLFGLATHAARQRTKEIGVRKVLGASVGSITRLLSKDFLILVSIGLVVASPIAYYLMNRWLQEFVFRIDIKWWIFLLAGLISILIAFTTVSIQGIRAALANPIDSLRDE